MISSPYYHGVFKSKEEAALSIAEQEGEISWHLKNCIDYTKMVENLAEDYHFIEFEDKVYLFTQEDNEGGY